MSLRLPLTGSATRDLIDLAQLAELGARGFRDIPAFRQALTSSREWLAAEPAARSVNTLVLRADGELWLVRVTARAWSRVWNFGKAVA
jgi:hypothetical protein